MENHRETMGHNGQVEEEGYRPKWLLELENRKRKPRLAHELGAGAPCIKCTSSCPGLDLHFWRKICKNCKCSRDDHDVPDEDFPQFNLLFGPSGIPKKKTIVLKRQAAEETFEWAPPDTSKELAADYMKALPEDKLPIRGSAGAALRKQQLQKQLPLHDIDHKVCDELTDSERKQFEKYLENLKTYVGQGKVTKFTTAKPFDKALMTPANASECFTPKHKPSNVISSNSPNLRTPSSFVPKINRNLSPEPVAALGRREVIANPISNQSLSENTSLGRYHHVLNEIRTENQISQSANMHNQHSPYFAKTFAGNMEVNAAAQFAQSNLHNEPSSTPGDIRRDNVNRDLATSDYRPLKSHQWAKQLGKSEENFEGDNSVDKMLSDALLPPSAIHSQDIVASTLDRKGLSFIREKLTSKYGDKEEAMQRHQAMRTREIGGGYQSKVETINEGINPQLIASGGVNSSTVHSELGPEGQSSMRSKELNDSSFDMKMAIATPNPQEIISKGINPQLICTGVDTSSTIHSELAPELNRNFNQPPGISNPSQNTNKPINPQLMTCGGITSSILHSETLQNPVFPESSIGAIRTLEPINNLTGVFDKAMHINPPKQKCHQCSEDIVVGDVIVTAEKAKDAAWHPGCFVCSICNELLVDLVYFYQKGKLYCGRDFAELLQIHRCFACDELIFVNEYTVAEGHTYHIKHFCCWECDEPLAGQQYVSESDRPLCLPCFQKTYAKTCSACRKVIAADQQGVAVKGLDFHATDECFCCASCRKSLLNGRMAIKEERPFCSKECISHFFNK